MCVLPAPNEQRGGELARQLDITDFNPKILGVLNKNQIPVRKKKVREATAPCCFDKQQKKKKKQQQVPNSSYC